MWRFCNENYPSLLLNALAYYNAGAVVVNSESLDWLLFFLSIEVLLCITLIILPSFYNLRYQQKFDLESDNIVVRGIGTAVTLATTAAHKELTFKE
jgi:hypothetical protein